MNNPYVLILAGGSGHRIWPLSREKRPKQVLSITSKKSLIEETIDRSLLLTTKKNIFIGTNSKIKKIIHSKIKWLTKDNFILEPIARNTAPIIALFCAFLKDKKKDIYRPIVVLSADHYISPSKAWANVLKKTFSSVNKFIYCIGVSPRSAETEYGYIQLGNPLDQKKDHYKIKKFTEKPDIKKAIKYVKSGSFLWNSGMFVFSANLFLDELKNIHPEIYSLSFLCARGEKKLKEYFPKMPNISVDYAVLEKSSKLAVARASFDWRDMGSFGSIKKIKKPDNSGQFISPGVQYRSIDSKNNLILSENKKLKFALLGVNGLVIVESENTILIAQESQIQKIKELREQFPNKDR